MEVCHFVTDLLFNYSTEWTNTHHFIITFFSHIFFSCIAHCQVDFFLRKGLIDIYQHQINNLRKVFLAQVWEFNDSVETVQEFWTEVRFQTIHEFWFIRIFCQVGFVTKASVWSSDNYSVLEVDRIPLTICQTTIVQNLEEKGDHLRIRLFNFVKKDDWVWVTANTFCQSIAVVIITNITSCCTNQFRNSCAVAVFWHVQTDDSIFSSEHIKSQLFSQLSFTNTSRSYKEEATDWTVTFVKSCTVTTDGTCHCFNGFILTDNLSLQTVTHIFQTFDISCTHLWHWNTRHPFYRFGHIVDCCCYFMVFRMVFNFLFKFFDTNFCIKSCFVIFFSSCSFLFSFFFFNFMFHSMDICYWMLGCQVSSCHIDQVNGLIRQATLWNVLDRIINRCFQNFIWQDDIVVFFIKITDSLKNLERIFSWWSIDLHFVKTTSKSRILQDGVTIFILSGCPNDCQFPTWKSRFDDICKTFRSLTITCATCTKDLMDFIKEENDISHRLDFLDQILNIFFKATTVLRTSF